MDSLNNNLDSLFHTESKQNYSPQSRTSNNKTVIKDNNNIDLKPSVQLVSRQTSPILILNSSNVTTKRPSNNIEPTILSREITNLNIQRILSPSYSLSDKNDEKSFKIIEENNNKNQDVDIKENEFPSTNRT